MVQNSVAVWAGSKIRLKNKAVVPSGPLGRSSWVMELVGLFHGVCNFLEMVWKTNEMYAFVKSFQNTQKTVGK